jgi:hypothetical protein
MANVNWRTINIDALDPDSPANFDLSSLTPAVTPVSTADVQSLASQIRQLLRGGDNEGALQGALENPPYGADDKGKVRRSICYLNTTPRNTVSLSPARSGGTLLSNVSPHPALAVGGTPPLATVTSDSEAFPETGLMPSPKSCTSPLDARTRLTRVPLINRKSTSLP